MSKKKVHHLIRPFVLLNFLAFINLVLGRNRRYQLGDDIPNHTFSCMSCEEVRSDTTQLDNFRVRQLLTKPFCKMEPVECAPYQDACVTITMQVNNFILY